MKRKRITLWIIGLLITLTAAVYQKVTGPTYPRKITTTLNNKQYKLKLLRSHGGKDDATIVLKITDPNVKAKLFWKHYPAEKNESFNVVSFKKGIKKDNFLFWKFETKGLLAKLPHQPPAGKLMYYIELTDNNKTQTFLKENPVIIRYKGAVPPYVLGPHILFIFFAMFLANVTGLFAAFKIPQFKRYTGVTLILITIGGMILGPIVQKFAFLEYWAGVPYGWDLTDNKLLIAFLAWLIAFFLNIKKGNRVSVIIASIVTIIIFSIPHSMHGSQLNRETGTIIQGFIQLYF
ncbi:MAG: hypothetical protein GXO80_04435 [Chlorobi bacterium]|nr:hypothetical protein [Chlorobiota bacterium]